MAQTTARYEVIESKVWKCTDGRTASAYGACPWLSEAERAQWTLVTRGYTVRDNVLGTVGIGRAPWQTREEAQQWADAEHARLAEIAAAMAAARPTRGTTGRALDARTRKSGPNRPVRK